MMILNILVVDACNRNNKHLYFANYYSIFLLLNFYFLLIVYNMF
jgi:hypothetical protein